MSPQLTITKIDFKTKKAALDYVRSKVKDFDPNDPLWPALIDRHPQRTSKIGPGIKSFFYKIHPMNKQKTLFIERMDGTVVDFSWRTCINGVNNSQWQNLYAAMRESVSGQIASFRSSCVNATHCGMCSNVLLKSHVDHVIPFDFLVQNFLENAGTPPSEFDDCEKTYRAKFKYTDKDFSMAWQAFHSNYASLRLICSSCNLERPRGA